jgi:hypothetical protein
LAHYTTGRDKKQKTLNDGFATSPEAALHGILFHCGVRKSTPHASGSARLACGAFYEAVVFGSFFDFLRTHHQ